jgi:stress-induced morphogen
LSHAASPGWKQGGLPGEKPFRGEGIAVSAGCVEHHFYNALHVPVDGLQSANVHAQPAGNGGAHLTAIKVLSFDFAGLENVVGQRAQNGFLLQREAESLHASEQTTLLVTHQR